MLLELSEALACPRCGPPQNVVVVVDSIADRRVSDGFLACPECDSRYAIRDGVVRVVETEAAVTSSGPASTPEAGAATHPDTATIIAALLGFRGGGGFVLLGPGLGVSAAALSKLVRGTELVALDPSAGGPELELEGEAPAVSRFRVDPRAPFPVLDSRFIGVALLRGSAASFAEAVRTLVKGGRLIVLRPAAETESALADLPFEVLARDEKALVARRT